MGDAAGADKILVEGRTKFPDDPSLLFTEINALLKAGKLDELIDRLKQAIKKEEGNIGLYVTLGNVYDNLFQSMLKEKNDAKATEYFTEANKYYGQALARDPKNVDATYSIGALYYNKAAFLTQEMNEITDFSGAGLKKLDALKNQVMGLFDQALPYFQKAESLNPNDTNTLVALTEIFARKEDELSLEFKKRLNVVKAGGKNETAYFKN
jgi:tetratricopeptide (TPR) repeat protein